MSGIKKRWVRNYILIIIFVMIFAEGMFINLTKNYYYNSIEQNLLNRVDVTAGFINKYLGRVTGDNQNSIKNAVEDYSFKESSELQVVDRWGKILFSSSGIVPKSKIQTPDYIGALNGNTTSWIGRNESTQEKIMAVSSPLKSIDHIYGTIRIVTSMEEVDKNINNLILTSIIVVIVIMGLMLILSILFSKSIIHPLNEINTAAKKMAKGKFSERIHKRYNDEIGELADTLNYMAGEISKVQELKNDFISSVSHELRTPLTSIKGWGETILIGDLEDEAQTKKGLKIIIKETARLTKMVEELLDFSRMESGRMVLELEGLDIKNELEDIVQIFDLRAKKEGLELNYSCKTEIPELTGDKNRLRQVFINILDNAIKFTPPGKKIFVNIDSGDQNVYITIKDEGIGMTEEELTRAREKFYKGKTNKSGSGIGLAVSDEIVKLHKGSLNIESNHRQGTTITITLPIS